MEAPFRGPLHGNTMEILIQILQTISWRPYFRTCPNDVPESNDLMRGSYAMLDAIGRFYTNVDGGHSYGPSIIDVGVERAWNENRFLEDRFIDRGGLYEWGSGSIKLPMASKEEI